ncbi:hypothetical protein DFS34DRAFT_620832 [Phlyctochytrium arcticum]|nr:hypothetical protein DFS34DRAFT_640800 [Phlyctochytrium arcticum]KAI9097209.1 hypothetical protein DFS34DRAFT_620832 [Phlyctochytrium arcticum]
MAQTIGTTAQAIPKFMQQRNEALTIYVGVTAYMLASETFNWVLYLRFNAVTPFRHTLQVVTRVWLSIESLALLANYVLWMYATATSNFELRRNCNKAYSGLSVVQAATALFLSGYFTKVYYFPRLKPVADDPKSRGTVTRLFTSGLIYLFLECVLHLGFTVLYQSIPKYYTSANNVATAVRYSIFLTFVFQIRNASEYSKQATSSRLSTFGSGDGHELHNFSDSGETKKRSSLKPGVSSKSAAVGPTSPTMQNAQQESYLSSPQQQPYPSFTPPAATHFNILSLPLPPPPQRPPPSPLATANSAPALPPALRAPGSQRIPAAQRVPSPKPFASIQRVQVHSIHDIQHSTHHHASPNMTAMSPPPISYRFPPPASSKDGSSSPLPPFASPSANDSTTSSPLLTHSTAPLLPVPNHSRSSPAEHL